MFHMDSSIMRALTFLGELVLVNLLFILGCIPVVTIGPSLAAMYHTLFCIDEGRGSSTLVTFWQGFRSDLKQGIAAMLVFAAAAALLYCNRQILTVFAFPPAAQTLVIIPSVLLWIIWLYLWPLMARFENGLLRSMLNALRLGLAHLPRSIALSAIHLWPVGVFLAAPEILLRGGIFWVFLGFSAAAWLSILVLKKVFQPYLEPITQEEQV